MATIVSRLVSWRQPQKGYFALASTRRRSKFRKLTALLLSSLYRLFIPLRRRSHRLDVGRATHNPVSSTFQTKWPLGDNKKETGQNAEYLKVNAGIETNHWTPSRFIASILTKHDTTRSSSKKRGRYQQKWRPCVSTRPSVTFHSPRVMLTSD